MRSFSGRPVHVLVLSGLSRDAYRAGLEAGYLSALDFLSNAGIARTDCVAPFPSVTPTAVATIATGGAPSLHGVLGRTWYSRKAGCIREFDPVTAGSPAFDYLDDKLEEAGRRVFTLNVPTACGGSGIGVGLPDRYVVDLTRGVIRDGRPDLTISVLRELDTSGHALGPCAIMPSLLEADRQLGRLLEAYGSWENALATARWIVVGDHGMSPVRGESPSHVIGSTELALGRRDVVVTLNGRTAFLYLRASEAPEPRGARPDRKAEREAICLERQALAEALAELPAVDQVFWREESWTCARQRDLTCSWRPGGGFHDMRGREWQVTGDVRALGLELSAGQLLEGAYPDPMHRVDDLLDAADAPDLVVTARPDYEFAPQSGRGSHGSLLAQDSLVPIIAAGFGLVPHYPEARDVGLLAMGALLPEEAFGGYHQEIAAGKRKTPGLRHAAPRIRP